MRSALLKLIVVGLLIAAAGAAVAFWQRDALTQWYAFRDFEGTPNADPAAIVKLGEAALPRLHDRLAAPDRLGVRYAEVFAAVTNAWEPADPRWATWAPQWVDRLPGWHADAQTVLLRLVPKLIAHPEARCQAAGRELLKRGFQHPKGEQRIECIRLALRPNVQQFDGLAQLLKDPDADVRRSALLAVGALPQVVSDEELLPWLHDADAQVRELCATVLQSRGLRERDVELGRLLTHPNIGERLKLLSALKDEDADVDIGVWLTKLSQDAAPAVRAATARVWAERPVASFAARVREMATADPDLTTRQIVQSTLKSVERLIEMPIRPASFQPMP